MDLDASSVVTILGGQGNDTYRFDGTNLAPAIRIDGGGGTNTLDYSTYTGTVQVILPLGMATGCTGGIKNIENVTGSQGNNLLVGDANPNVLIGGTGRNVIIGGAGADTLDASAATSDNILIGGTTNFDTNLAALDAIFAEWTRTDLGFADRFSDLTTFTNSAKAIPMNAVNGNPILLTNAPVVVKGLVINPTVHADTSIDTLTGSIMGAARNWFIVDSDDTITGGLPRKGKDKLTKAK
jgi:Ca2+-binding RTX toxin-like protein